MNHSQTGGRYTGLGLGGTAPSRSRDFDRSVSNSSMAESTRLEGVIGGNRSQFFSSPSKSVIIGSGTSAKRKPTSPLLNSRTSFKSSSNLASGFGRIDQQIYTDAQSRGLVNRLVKYHDTSQALNRSQSLTSLYSKPGQFPVVHLKKQELKYSPRRNNSSSISSVRIAPPEKSVFQANTRSNIMRSGSLLIPTESHLKMTPQQQGSGEDEIDAENRVIAPTAELDSAPTRSVLDALKEISRKRINNEELDADRIKKQCKELSEVDSGAVGPGGVKRARELPSSSSPPLKGSDYQKKRLCQKNNDISSSLSSSLVMTTPKRIEPVQMRPARLNVDQSFASMVTQHSFGGTALVDGETRFENREPIGKLNRIESEPLPKTRMVSVPEMTIPPVMVKPRPMQPKITLFNKKYDEILLRPDGIDDELNFGSDEDDEIGGRISFIKPKQKSPNLSSENVSLKQVEKSKLSLMLSCLSDEFDDRENEVSKPKDPVVVPEITIPIAKDVVDSPTVVEAEKNNETVKISGISALINNPIKDAGLGKIDPPNDLNKTVGFTNPIGKFTTEAAAKPKVSDSSNNNISKPSDSTFNFGTPTKQVDKQNEKLNSTFSFGTPVADAKATNSEPPPAYTFPTASSAAPVTSTPAVASTGFSLSPAVSSTTAASAIAINSSAQNLISFSPAAVPSIKSAFSIPPASSNNTPAPAATVSTTFGSGVGFSAFKPTQSAAQVVSSTTTSVTAFGTKVSTAASSAATASFTFGTSTSKPISAAPTTASTTSAGAFSFGSKPNTSAIGSAPSTFPSQPSFASTAPTTAPTAPAPAFSFGGSTATSAPSATPVFGVSSTTTNSGFGVFGGSKPSPVTTAPVFGASNTNAFNAPATSKHQAAATPFSFGTSQSSTSSANSNTGTSTFTFASGNTDNTPKSAASTSIFGTSSNNNDSNAPPAFGAQKPVASTFGAVSASNNNTTAPTAAAPVFGSGSMTSSPVFGTASNTNGTAPATAAGNAFGQTSVFGAPQSSQAVSSSNIFGSTTSAVGGMASPFGSSSVNNNTNSGGIFGAASNNATSAQPTAANNNLNGTFSFGAASSGVQAPLASKPFSFGGNNAAPNANPAASAPIKSNSFTFAGAGSQQSSTAAPLGGAKPGFSFSAGSSNANANSAGLPSFGNATQSAGSPFSLGANNTTNNNQATVKPFSFGGTTAPATAQAPVGGGIFNGASATSPVGQAPAFNFSVGSNAGQPPAFNFSAGSGSTGPTLATAGSPFSLLPSGETPTFSVGVGPPVTRRPIRHPTRRR
ncbi:mucin-19 [Uranotaenia lowii]|uniref:mucin-19 n=1 Tax=Uranotaenia lowii TaxID=190385 RepID=UPI0024783668|nr:mucin-19 [Uranotaenia lowii]XP_055605919.1 mucin-19 [Uranotaenia lowii]XP_055605920.1 mucin-19 [Uranotaenia lowii]